MRISKIFIWLCVSFFGLSCYHDAYAVSWHELKDKHFVIYYSARQDEKVARKTLRTAERYYNTIAQSLGYSRYSNFWTWDDRVRIIVFPDQRSFVAYTGQPEWSRGFADRYSDLFHSRVIITYRQEKNFLDGLLPHEVSHLILWDFIGFDTAIPIWFDEGVAQLHEPKRRDRARQLMRSIVRKNEYIPFNIFMQIDIQREKDPNRVAMFYNQSISVVDFMISEYGNEKFSRLCRNLKEGSKMEEAINKTYYPSLQSIGDLERKWAAYIIK